MKARLDVMGGMCSIKGRVYLVAKNSYFLQLEKITMKAIFSLESLIGIGKSIFLKGFEEKREYEPTFKWKPLKWNGSKYVVNLSYLSVSCAVQVLMIINSEIKV